MKYLKTFEINIDIANTKTFDASSNRNLEREYDLLQRAIDFLDYTDSRVDEASEKKKNRYPDILPCKIFYFYLPIVIVILI